MADSSGFNLPPLGSNVPTPPPLRPVQVQMPQTMGSPALPKPPSLGQQQGGMGQGGMGQMMTQALSYGLMGPLMNQMFSGANDPFATPKPPTPNLAGMGQPASPNVVGRTVSPASATSTLNGGTTDYHALATQYANQYGVPTDFFNKLIQQESGFNPNARSGAGAIGISQIMPQTAQGWGIDPTDPNASLQAAAKNLRAYADANGGSWLAAAISYNAGPGAWTTYQQTGYLPDETRRYVKSILGYDPTPVG